MKETVELANFRTKLDAEIAGGLLKNADIPYVIQSQEGMLHGPINPGATIYVARSQLNRATAVLRDAGMTAGEGE